MAALTNLITSVRSGFLTAGTVKSTFFWKMTLFILVATLSNFLEKQEIIEKRRKFGIESDMVGINYGSNKFKDMRIYQTETNSKNFVTAIQISYISKKSL